MIGNGQRTSAKEFAFVLRRGIDKMREKGRITMIGEKKKYLDSTMMEQEKLVAKVKSSLYSLSMDELAKKAIDAYIGQVPKMNCPYCKEQTVFSAKESMIHGITIAGQDYEVEITNYPRNFCRVCNSGFKNIRTSQFLSERINIEIFHSLRFKKSTGNIGI